MSESYTGIECLKVLKDADNYNQFLLQEIIKNSPNGQDKMAVDYGAGLGTYSEMARNAGFEIICVERDSSLKNILCSKGFTVHQDLNEFGPSSVPFIFGLNVLEHIEDDEEALRNLKRVLKKNGVLYLYVPAFNFLYSSMDKRVGHFRRYHKAALQALLEKVGLKVESISYKDSLGFFASLYLKYFGSDDGNISSPLVKLYDRFIFPLSRICDFFCGRLFGKNLAVKVVKESE